MSKTNTVFSKWQRREPGFTNFGQKNARISIIIFNTISKPDTVKNGSGFGVQKNIMICRCTSCNNITNFRNQRGNKLANLTCKCGGKFERLSWETQAGINPIFPEQTHRHPFTIGETYFQALKNGKGEYFVLAKNHVINIKL